MYILHSSVKKTPMQVYLDERDRELLDQLARREGLSLAETLRSAIRRWASEADATGDPILNLIGSIDEPVLRETRWAIIN